MTALAPAVESFFTGYLTAQRGASPHTIASYRDTFRLLFAWIREQSGTRPSDLDFADVDAATVSGFLAMLADERHNTSRTRSQRLATIHSLFRRAALGYPEHAALIARVLAIQPRKPSRKTVAWLTEDEADPLQRSAITGLRQWQRENPGAPGGFVFTARGTARKMSTDAVATRIKIHAATAAAACPAAQLRHAPAILWCRRALHRSPARSRVPVVNAPLPARRPRTQAEGPRPDRPAAHQDRPLHAPGQAPRLPRKPVRLCRTMRRGHRPDQRRDRPGSRTSA